MTIFKYPIPMNDYFDLWIPIGGKILTVQKQGENPCIWVLVNPKADLKKRQFRLAGTGHPIEDMIGMVYIGTFQLSGGAFVGHLFEIME